MEEHLPSVIARIGGIVLAIGLIMRRLSGDPALWRRRPRRALLMARAANALAIAMALAVAALAVVALVSYTEPFLRALAIMAIIAAWAAVAVLVITGISLAMGAVRRRLGGDAERRRAPAPARRPRPGARVRSPLSRTA